MRSLIKKIIETLSYVIERKQGIRRFILFTAFPSWLILSIHFGTAFLKGRSFDENFSYYYTTFSGIIGVIVGFYFHSRNALLREEGGKKLGQSLAKN